MEIIAVFMGIGFVGWLYERGRRQGLFPDQKCGYCPVWIHWDNRAKLWKHQGKVVYLTEPYRHAALPAYDPYRFDRGDFLS